MRIIGKLYNNRLIRAHTQNLAKEQRLNKKNKNNELLRCNDHLLHRRGWVDLFSDKFNLEWEYCTGLSLRIRLSVDPSEKNYNFSIGLLFITIYLTINGLIPETLFPKGYEEKEVSFEFHNNALWINLWAPTDSWCKDQRSYTVHFDDIILGKSKYSKEVIYRAKGKLELPEAIYDINYKIGLQEWKRSRWFKKERDYVEASCEKGIPVPGKGESSYDCDDSLLFSTGAEGNDINAVKLSLYNSVKRKRERYGSGMEMYINKV